MLLKKLLAFMLLAPYTPTYSSAPVDTEKVVLALTGCAISTYAIYTLCGDKTFYRAGAETALGFLVIAAYLSHQKESADIEQLKNNNQRLETELGLWNRMYSQGALATQGRPAIAPPPYTEEAPALSARPTLLSRITFGRFGTRS